MMTHSQFIDSLMLRMQDREVGLAPPRPFLVNWVDEYVGQRSTVVLARTAEDAREIAENATGRYAMDVQSL